MTDKHLTRKVLIETKWIRKPISDEDAQPDFIFKMPVHIITYCRICQTQHSHQRIRETKTGAWYTCVNCWSGTNE